MTIESHEMIIIYMSSGYSFGVKWIWNMYVIWSLLYNLKAGSNLIELMGRNMHVCHVYWGRERCKPGCVQIFISCGCVVYIG